MGLYERQKLRVDGESLPEDTTKAGKAGVLTSTGNAAPQRA
jgi:hypothetical protein